MPDHARMFRERDFWFSRMKQVERIDTMDDFYMVSLLSQAVT
jgi:hypothetical protein